MTSNLMPQKLATVVALLGLLWLAGCGKKEGPKTVYEDPKYAGWQFTNFQNIKFFHPPNHPQEGQFEAIARSYIRDINEVCRLLGIDTPTDTLVIFYYTGFGQGRELTGQEYPFAQDSIIHFWLPSFLGPTMMDHLLPYWVKGTPKYKFLREGLRALFDYSGQNYHKSTMGYIKEGKFMPLSQLAADTSINSNTERYQSAEAASFIAYILADYKSARLKTMYMSDLPFDQMVQQLFFMPVDSLQAAWLEFAKESTPPDTTDLLKQIDSVQR